MLSLLNSHVSDSAIFCAVPTTPASASPVGFLVTSIIKKNILMWTHYNSMFEWHFNLGTFSIRFSRMALTIASTQFAFNDEPMVTLLHLRSGWLGGKKNYGRCPQTWQRTGIRPPPALSPIPPVSVVPSLTSILPPISTSSAGCCFVICLWTKVCEHYGTSNIFHLPVCHSHVPALGRKRSRPKWVPFGSVVSADLPRKASCYVSRPSLEENLRCLAPFRGLTLRPARTRPSHMRRHMPCAVQPVPHLLIPPAVQRPWLASL